MVCPQLLIIIRCFPRYSELEILFCSTLTLRWGCAQMERSQRSRLYGFTVPWIKGGKKTLIHVTHSPISHWTAELSPCNSVAVTWFPSRKLQIKSWLWHVLKELTLFRGGSFDSYLYDNALPAGQLSRIWLILLFLSADGWLCQCPQWGPYLKRE